MRTCVFGVRNSANEEEQLPEWVERWEEIHMKERKKQERYTGSCCVVGRVTASRNSDGPPQGNPDVHHGTHFC